MGILSSLEPHEVFKYFEEICAIPHGSGNTDAISNYLTDFAKSNNLKYIQDESNNVIIFKDGTEGYEDSAPVMLQGHMDMVTVKDDGCDLNMENEGLRLRLKDGIISADGTSLGGDDGIAVAFALAILASNDISHPPLEAVFTVDEEIGMLGATALDCSPLKSRIMLNLDSEEEGHLLVSCAGGATVTCRIPFEPEKPEEDTVCVRVSVTGVTGGHSGTEINKQGANACKLLGRFLNSVKTNLDYRLADISGGLKDNAIPISASALIVLANDSDIETLSELAHDYTKVFQHEYLSTDENICIETAKEIRPDSAMSFSDTESVISALVALPNGVQKMSNDFDGLVQTSLNLGIMSTVHSDEPHVSLSFSVRSSVSTEKYYLIEQLETITLLSNGSADVSGEYPAWEFRKNSALRDLMVDTFKDLYGKEPIVESIHAGVECGIFASKLENLDCVSYGPDMTDIHTTNESMDVESVKRTWEYTLEILRRLK